MLLLTFVALLTGPYAFARPYNPLFSTYCAALLEHQRPVDRELAVNFSDALKKALLRAEALSAAYETPTTPDGPTTRYLPIRVESFGPPKTLVNLLPPNAESRSLNRIPERISDLHTHVNSIRDGVVAAGLMIRGEENIAAYFERLKSATYRNDDEVRFERPEALPFFTKTRAAVALLAAATPTVPLGMVLYWAGPAFLELRPSFWQWASALGIIPASIAAMPYGLGEAATFARGMISEDARHEFETDYGRRAVVEEYQAVKMMGRAARRLRKRRAGLAYFTTQRTFSATEVRDIKAAGAAGHAPSDEFLRRQESPEIYRDIGNALLPISYDLITDHICYFDEDGREPVLLTFTRFIRSLSYPPKKPREKRSGSSSPVFDIGGLRPAGA